MGAAEVDWWGFWNGQQEEFAKEVHQHSIIDSGNDSVLPQKNHQEIQTSRNERFIFGRNRKKHQRF